MAFSLILPVCICIGDRSERKNMIKRMTTSGEGRGGESYSGVQLPAPSARGNRNLNASLTGSLSYSASWVCSGDVWTQR